MSAKVTNQTLEDYGLTTAEFAADAGVKPASVRTQLCLTGSYFGIVPKRLPNDRLVWPCNAKQLLLNAPHKARVRPVPHSRAQVSVAA